MATHLDPKCFRKDGEAQRLHFRLFTCVQSWREASKTLHKQPGSSLLAAPRPTLEPARPLRTARLTTAMHPWYGGSGTPLLSSCRHDIEEDLVERRDCRRELGDGQYYRARSFAQASVIPNSPRDIGERLAI